jgi:hypothetical protein
MKCTLSRISVLILLTLFGAVLSVHPQCEKFRSKPGSIMYPTPDAPGAINVTFAQLFSFCSQLAVRLSLPNSSRSFFNMLNYIDIGRGSNLVALRALQRMFSIYLCWEDIQTLHSATNRSENKCSIE